MSHVWKRRSVGPGLFFAISHGVSWLFWGLAIVLAGDDIWQSPARWLVYLGGLGPPAAGITLTYLNGGAPALRQLAARVLDPRRIPPVWMLAAILIPVAAMAFAVALGSIRLTGGEVDATQLSTLMAAPASILGFALFVLLFGPVPEEIGWRGYALDALQQDRTALSASLWLGAAWALWHAPLFFISGYYGEGGRPDPVLFTTALLVHSIVYTALYNATDRSVLVAIVFHFMVNFVGMLVEGDLATEWSRTGFTAAIAIVLIFGRGMHRRPHLGSVRYSLQTIGDIPECAASGKR